MSTAPTLPALDPVQVQRFWDECMAARLERFAAVMAEQVPASTPWRPVTDYSFEARRAIEGRHPELIRDVLLNGDLKRKVLDYGCGPDAILVRLLRDCGVMAYGRDPILKRQWWCFLADEDGDEDHGPSPDTIVCREVLEHLTIREIQSTIRHWLRYYSPRLIYVTTRFAKAPRHLLDVDTSDDLDPTHITMLTKPFLRLLFILQGCKSRPDLEEKMDWQQQGRVLVFEVPRD